MDFTQTQLFCEWDETHCSEIFPVGYLKELLNKVLVNKQPIVMKCWVELVHQFSTRQLTFSRDKLVPLSGLEKLFH
jgi:hypothetical protein